MPDEQNPLIKRRLARASAAGGARKTSRATQVAALVTSLGAGSCDSCSDDRPYTPFTVGSSLAPPSSSASATADAAPAPFVMIRALSAPPDATRWRLGDLEIGAPDGEAFSQGLSADIDLDGRADAVAWVVPRPQTPASQGRLLYYQGKNGGPAAPREIATVPPFVPVAPDCRLEVRLAQTGKRTVTLNASARCETPRVARSPSRALVVVAPAQRSPVVVSLRIAEPAPGESFDFAVDSQDQDADGRDDVAITVTLRVSSDSAASVQLIWHDRAAGLARNPQEPMSSLTSIGSLAVTRSSGKNTARAVPRQVAAARRLFATLCAEGAVPRVFEADGAPLRCGDVMKAFEHYATAEARAALTLGKYEDAFGVLERDGWHFRPLKDPAKRALEGELVRRVRARPARLQVISDAVPRAAGSTPRYSPLSFTAGGELHVQTAAGVMRTDVASGKSEDASEDVDPWPLLAVGPDGARWTGVSLPCDRSDVVLLVSSTEGAPLEPRPVDLIAPRPGACGSPPRVFDPKARPVDWSRPIPAVLVAGSLLGTERAGWSSTPARGSPRSPDGRLLVSVTPLGVLITGGDKPELWQGEARDAHAALGDCVITNGATAAACIRAGRELVVIRPE